MKTDTIQHEIAEVYKICQDYCNSINICVTVTQTRFIYVNGWEDGVAVGLINYPRFPRHHENIKNNAIELASLLKEAMQQKRVSIVMPAETIMLGQLE